MPSMKQQVVNTIVQWALNLAPPNGQIRVNRKLLFGDPDISSAVAAALQPRSNDRRAFIVRNSTEVDAVRLRNGRPSIISADAAIVYLLFWLPGLPGHERNFESLRDFPEVTLDNILGRSDSFVLPEEALISAQCSEAAQAWPEKDQRRAEEHLQTAWAALRTCLRERRGGRDRSIPFIDQLDDYLKYLSEAAVPESVWQQTAIANRAAMQVERWGRALPRLSMFTLPALASVIGIQVDPQQSIPSAKKSGEVKWVDAIEEILAENRDTATDFAGLEESIAGHQTLRERLDALTAKIRLCPEAADCGSARAALESFCQSGDESALSLVEWLFHQNPADRRSASQGLKGLLIARKLREPRENPFDKAARETTALIDRLAGDEIRESGVVRQYIEEWKTRTVQSNREAMIMADILHTVATGSVPSNTGTLGPIFDRVLASPDRSAEDFERLARVWEKFGLAGGDAPVVADSVLLGLVQLCCARLREQDASTALQRLKPNDKDAGELVLNAAVEGQRTSLKLRTDDWGEHARTEIHKWLLEEVGPLYFDESSADVEEEVPSITLDIEWRRGGASTPFGVIEIPVPERRAELVTLSRKQALISFRREGRFSLGRILGELFETSEAESQPRTRATMHYAVGGQRLCAPLETRLTREQFLALHRFQNKQRLG